MVAALADQLSATLARLLDEADRGRTPMAWTLARVTMNPHKDEAAPTDLRPSTVMVLTYRLWAKKHAAALNSGLASWKPSGLSGRLWGQLSAGPLAA